MLFHIEPQANWGSTAEKERDREGSMSLVKEWHADFLKTKPGV